MEIYEKFHVSCLKIKVISFNRRCLNIVYILLKLIPTNAGISLVRSLNKNSRIFLLDEPHDIFHLNFYLSSKTYLNFPSVSSSNQRYNKIVRRMLNQF